jgi:hypothetical protein
MSKAIKNLKTALTTIQEAETTKKVVFSQVKVIEYDIEDRLYKAIQDLPEFQEYISFKDLTKHPDSTPLGYFNLNVPRASSSAS